MVLTRAVIFLLISLVATVGSTQPITARSMWNSVLSAAQDSAADAELIVVTTSAPITLDGTAPYWDYLFRSPTTGTTYLVVAVRSSSDSISVTVYPPEPSHFQAMPFTFADSPVAVQSAEANGGSAYRTTYPNATFRVMALTWLPEDPARGIWSFTYESTGNPSLTEYVDFATGTYLTVDQKESSLPQTMALHPNYPNPFNATTTISFDLPRASRVKLAVFDNTGRKVANLADGLLQAGSHVVRFNASRLPSGTYYYRLQAGRNQTVRAMTLLK